VLRDGADRPEPVEVAIEDEDGNVEVVVWDGPGPRGVVEAHMPSPIDDVEIDPRHRLPQAAELADGHPLGDDATSKPFRPPLLTGFGLNLALSEGQVFGFISFAIRRKYDLEEAFSFTLSHLSSTTGGTARYVRGFGPKRTTNSRIASIGGGLDFDRVRDDFLGAGVGGWRLSLVANAGFDTRAYFVDPREGSSLGLSGRVGGVLRDDDTFGITGSIGIRGSHTVTLGQLSSLLLVAGGGWTFGDALSGELQQLGGRFLLRGFETRELVGRGSLYAVAEHRYTPIRDLRWNILHIAWLREIQLAFWTGAGMTIDSVRTAAGVPNGGLRAAAEVGTGLRFHYTYGGVQPGVMSLDFGFPLTRDPDAVGSDGRLNGARLPFGLYLSFDQFF
jgi:outer membrane protein assembly factor BamA